MASNSSADDVADAIKLDPVIAARVLRLANSAYIGMPNAVSSLKKAVVVLGRRRVHSLVIAASALVSLRTGRDMPFEMRTFWRHSIAAGMMAESIARHLKRYQTIDPGELFCGGLLHDIGKLVLGTCDRDRVEAVGALMNERKAPFFCCEDEECSHTVIGGAVADKWRFPPDLRSAIADHHVPDEAPPEFAMNTAIVHVADAMAHVAGFDTLPDEEAPRIGDGALAMIELAPERLGVISSSCMQDQKQVESLIEALN